MKVFVDFALNHKKIQNQFVIYFEIVLLFNSNDKNLKFILIKFLSFLKNKINK